MLRKLFFVLLALNAGLLTWNFNLLAPLGLPALPPVGEPERLQQQVHPERLQILPMPLAVPGQATPEPESAAGPGSSSAEPGPR